MTRIGYLIPEFPGQTHTFFWRERKALAARGVEAELVSTRRPVRGIVSQAWANAAISETRYLAPPSHKRFGAIARALVQSIPGGWFRCLASVRRAQGLDAVGRARLLALAGAGADLCAMAQERGWRHIHAHSCADAAHVAMFAHLLSGIPYSLTLHGPLRDYGPNQREKWRHARFAIVITERLFAEVQRELAGSLPPAVEIAPMGVEPESFLRSRAYQPWRGGRFKIFTCGRLNPCKGHADLIEAVGVLATRGVDVRLEVAGEDEQGGRGYHRTLQDMIDKLGLGQHVRLLGAVSEDVVRDGLENAHVFALASLEEPLGVAIMEAMAMKLPVLVTRSGGVPELVEDGVDGLMVAPRAPQELVAALDKLRNDHVLCVKLGERGREKIVARFDAGRGAEVIARLL